jgi:aryl-alcohol dehydrogenase-like predicted oxidoreductase
MRYRHLGDTGVEVSVVALGAMMFGAPEGGRGGNSDRDECVRMIHTALDAGINLIDTADVYSGFESERIVGEAIKGRRDEVVVATKFGQRAGGRNTGGASRAWIVRAVEDSLRRLDADDIDLYQQHVPDYTVAPEETLGALDHLVRSGKVRVIGSSNFPAEMLMEYRHVADRLGTARMYCEQLPYNIFVRHVEPSVLPTCRRLGLGVIVWSPLNMGWLAGRYRRATGLPEDSRAARGFPGVAYADGDPVTERKLDLVEELALLAADAGLSLGDLAHAWVLEHPAVTAAIIGPRIPSQLEASLGAADVVLDDDLLDRIDRLCPPGHDVNPADTQAFNAHMRRGARRRGRTGA